MIDPNHDFQANKQKQIEAQVRCNREFGVTNRTMHMYYTGVHLWPVLADAYAFGKQDLANALLPFTGRARATDPQTSHDAAKKLDLTRSHKQVAFLLSKMQGAQTDEAMWLRYESIRSHYRFLWTDQQSQSGLRSRRSELVKAGYVRDSGTRKHVRSGNKAVAWELTDLGAGLVAEINP